MELTERTIVTNPDGSLTSKPNPALLEAFKLRMEIQDLPQLSSDAPEGPNHMRADGTYDRLPQCSEQVDYAVMALGGPSKVLETTVSEGVNEEYMPGQVDHLNFSLLNAFKSHLENNSIRVLDVEDNDSGDWE